MDRIRVDVVFWSILCAGGLTYVSGSHKYQEFNLTSIEIAEKFGYPSEAHNIETEDGYFIMLFRIPNGKKTAVTHEVPVLLVHGMVATSEEFLLLGENSLAFVLADAGFDVWLPNFRGNPHSRTHKRFTIYDDEFWEFSWHENGVYDLPASIDYVCNYTKSDDVLFIGYSMGATAFFVMASERPEYQRKIRAGLMMGPVAFLKHVESAIKLIAPLSGIIQMDCVPKAVMFLTVCASGLTLVSGNQKYDDFNLTSAEIIEKYGYPLETHNIETEDGYFLFVLRTPHGRKHAATHQVPVVLVHALFGSSDQYLILGRDSLAFVLADAGFDVWLPNFRGNSYSRTHKRFTVDDNEFWDFSWHENGVYDLPACIDYVCNHTKSNDVLVIGHSMGTTMYFVMASELPEYQQKIRGGVMMGPAAFLKNIESAIKLIAPLSGILQSSARTTVHGEFSVQSESYQRLITHLCTAHRAQKHMCRNIIFFLAGTDHSQFDERLLPNILSHFPSSTSTKTLAHYGQIISSGKFRQYDYGLIKNMKIYNQTSPPEYNLQSITIPTSLFVGDRDHFVSEKDLAHLLKELKSVESVYRVRLNTFTHLDFVVAKNAKKLVYIPIVKKLEELINLKNCGST